MVLRALGIFGVAFFATGCRTPEPPRTALGSTLHRDVAGLPVAVRIEHAGESEIVLDAVERGVRGGLEAAASLGALRRPLLIQIHPDSASFQRAAGRVRPGLVGWATEERILLARPTLRSGSRLSGFERLVRHELVHVIHYQRAGIPASRTRRDDPFWFREGLAIVVAGEGGTYPSLHEATRLRQAWPDADWRDPSEELLAREGRLAYALAYHAVARLVRERGMDAIGAVLDALAEGRAFPSAFESVYGCSVATAWDRSVDPDASPLESLGEQAPQPYQRSP